MITDRSIYEYNGIYSQVRVLGKKYERPIYRITARVGLGKEIVVEAHYISEARAMFRDSINAFLKTEKVMDVGTRVYHQEAQRKEHIEERGARKQRDCPGGGISDKYLYEGSDQRLALKERLMAVLELRYKMVMQKTPDYKKVRELTKIAEKYEVELEQLEEAENRAFHRARS